MSSYHSPIIYLNFEKSWYKHLNHYRQFEEVTKMPMSSKIFEILNDCVEMVNESNCNPIPNYINLPIQFVAQACLPEGEAYESFIAKTGQIPTRDNYHDLLNGLIWLNFPKSKAVFNQLHMQDISQNGINGSRSPLRNALTVFDENGGIVVSSDNVLLEKLQNFEWNEVLFKYRAHWLDPNRDIAFVPFGHALLEKMITPRKNITSHTLLIQVDDKSWFEQSIEIQRDQLDTAVSKIFAQRKLLATDHTAISLTSKNFQPLPIMGIPSYCNANLHQEFYQDTSVFRSPRTIKAPIFRLVDLK